MSIQPLRVARGTVGILLLGAVSLVALTGCGRKEPPAPAASAPPPATAPPADASAPPPATPTAALPATEQTWTPEDLEALLAPVALYPDPVLVQVLSSATNPQEVLDAGNWLIANPDAKGKALDAEAEKMGFTPPVRALMQFRNVVDQMCLEMDWTTELGQAYTNDQVGVLAAVQRLRAQAVDVGNLQSSDQLKVETKQEADGSEVVTIQPPSPQVVYVPTYNPQTVYAPAPAQTTTTTTTESSSSSSSGYSTGAMVTTGLLSFGAGLLVGEIFDDDDDYYGYPSYWGGYPPRPPYPYYPNYGNGYRPGNNYNRSGNYNKVLSDNNFVVVNPERGNDYFKDYKGGADGSRGRAKSPITQANANRDTARLKDSSRAPSSWKGQNQYAGSRPEARQKANLPVSNKAANKAAANAATARRQTAGTSGANRSSDRGYAGANRASTSQGRSSSGAAKPAQTANRPGGGTESRSRPSGAQQPSVNRQPTSSQSSRPRPSADSGDSGRRTAAGGSGRGGADRAASQRGRSSSKGARSGGGGGGGGGGRSGGRR